MKDIDKLNLFIEIIVGFLTIAGAAYAGLRVMSNFLNRHRDTRKEFLKKLNEMYSLFEDGENFVYGYNREADKTALIRNLDKSVKEIRTFHTLNDDSDALAIFFEAYEALIHDWNKALNANWQEWCDSAKGSAFKDRNPNWDAFSIEKFYDVYDFTRNWDAFSMEKFYDVYDSTRKNLNVLRKQVHDSIS